MPVFGFNTDLKVGKTVFHVQTEDRGANNPVIDTTIYVKGRVLAKRGTSYQDFLVSPDFNEEELHAMLERQHKQIMEEVKGGTLPEMVEFLETEAAAAAPPPPGLQLKVLNPGTFLKGGTARLEIGAADKKQGHPVAGAVVRLTVRTGGTEAVSVEAKTDGEGKAALAFQMPAVGPDGAELAVEGSSAAGSDTLKFSIKPRPKAAS